MLSKTKNSQTIGELDELSTKGASGSLYMEYSQYTVNWLMKEMDVPLRPYLLVPHTEIVRVLDSVRNKVLDWALELESNGIIGEGMSFTEKEKKTATNFTYQITNNIRNMHNSQLQQDSPSANQILNISNDLEKISTFISNLKEQYNELLLSNNDRSDLKAEIGTIEQQLVSSKPKHIILNESLRSIRSILEGLTGSIIASNLLSELSTIL